MMGLQEFCTAVGIDETSASAVVGSSPRDQEQDAPWYVRVTLGVAAVITAAVIVAFGAALLALVGLDIEWAGFALGAMFFGLGLHRLASEPGEFGTTLGVVFAVAGISLASAAAGALFETLWAAAALAVPVAGFLAFRSPNDTLQFLASGLAALLIFGALAINDSGAGLAAAALMTALGTALLLRPPAANVNPSAYVLVLAGPLLAVLTPEVAPSVAMPVSPFSVWFARAVLLVIFLVLAGSFWRRAKSAGGRLRLAGFTVTAVLVALALPAGGSAALVLMTIAYVIGSRPLALGGIALEAYFVTSFYFDLDATLLDKSLLLMAVGVVLLGLWSLFARAPAAEAQS